MKYFLPLLASIIALSGCVGITIPEWRSAYERELTKPDAQEAAAREAFKHEGKHPVNGSVARTDSEWCGPTLWVLVPIPLWLPVCEKTTRVVYENNVPVNQVYSSTAKGTLYACGPLMPVLGMDGGPRGFCQKRPWWF